jgi:vanillate O-demethylase ferredoxin subunit
MNDPHMQLVIKQVRLEATGIHSYELISPTGSSLPRFSAGAHLDVHLPSGTIRQYSLANDPAQSHHYVIAVLNDAMGRGGSMELHRTFQVGQIVTVSAPRNHFHLHEDARQVFLLAGGIGITPLKAMAHRLNTLGIAFELHYCARSKDHLAFTEALQAFSPTGTVHYHLDGGKIEQGLSLPQWIHGLPEAAQLYYCGPTGLMQACHDALKSRPDIQAYCEHFKAPNSEIRNTTSTDDAEVFLHIQSTGKTVAVKQSESLIDALAKHGVDISTSCQSGLCGTCKTRFISGLVEHQDFILSDAEHMEFFTPCVSHIKSGTLVLDL